MQDVHQADEKTVVSILYVLRGGGGEGARTWGVGVWKWGDCISLWSLFDYWWEMWGNIMCLPELVQIAIPYVNLFKLFYVFTNETLFIFF